MKNKSLLFSILAAGLAGVALVKLGDTAAVAALPVETIFAIVFGVALAGFAASDNLRRFAPLSRRHASVLRPSLPAAPRAKAYGIRRSANVERTAA